MGEFITEYVSSGRGRRNGFHLPKSLRIKDITEWIEDIGIPFIKNGGSGNELCWFTRYSGRNLCIHFPSGTSTGTPIQFVLFGEDNDEPVTVGCVDDIALGRIGKACRYTYDLTDKDKIENYFRKIYEMVNK